MIGKDSHYTHCDLLIKVIYEHAISAIDITSCTDGQSTQYDRRSIDVPASVSLLHLRDVLMLLRHLYIIQCCTHKDVISDINVIYCMAAEQGK
jgi:hypothetical protein